MTINIPNIRVKLTIIFKILKLLNPVFFNIFNSSLSNNLIKKNCVEIKKINEKISKRVDGKSKAVNKNGKKKLDPILLKKEISPKILKINNKHKKIKETFIIFLINNLIK